MIYTEKLVQLQRKLHPDTTDAEVAVWKAKGVIPNKFFLKNRDATPENIGLALQLHPSTPDSTIRVWRHRGKVPSKYFDELLPPAFKREPLQSFISPAKVAWAREKASKHSVSAERWQAHMNNMGKNAKGKSYGGDAVADLEAQLQHLKLPGQKPMYYVDCLYSCLSAIQRKYEKVK